MWSVVDGEERVEYPANWWEAVKERFCGPLIRRGWMPSVRYKVVKLTRRGVYPTIPYKGRTHEPVLIFERDEWRHGGDND